MPCLSVVADFDQSPFSKDGIGMIIGPKGIFKDDQVVARSIDDLPRCKTQDALRAWTCACVR